MEEPAKPQPPTHERLGRDLVMVGLALVSIAILIYDEVKRPVGSTRDGLIVIDLAIVLIFAAEFASRLWRAESKSAFLKKNWYEIPGLVPMIVGEASFLRVFRLARIARIFRLFRVVAIVARLGRANRIAQRFLVRSHLLAVLGTFLVVLVGCSYGVWYFEGPAQPEQFRSYFDALWFAVVTATTVGYGDLYPVTTGGRVITVVLLFLGIGLVGVLAATMASALSPAGNEEEQTEDPSNLESRLQKLATLHERGQLTDAEFAAAKKKLLGESS